MVKHIIITLDNGSQLAVRFYEWGPEVDYRPNPQATWVPTAHSVEIVNEQDEVPAKVDLRQVNVTPPF